MKIDKSIDKFFILLDIYINSELYRCHFMKYALYKQFEQNILHTDKTHLK